MIASIAQGTSTTVSLLYDPEHARVQQVSPEGTTLYLNEARAWYYLVSQAG